MVEYDDTGKVKEFVELEAPKTEEAALEAGWTDSGFGLLCPQCSQAAAKETALEKELGVESGAKLERKGNEIQQAIQATTYYGMLKALHPEISTDTIAAFSHLLFQNDLSKHSDTGGGPPLSERVKALVPETEEQAREFLIVAETIKKALVKRE